MKNMQNKHPTIEELFNTHIHQIEGFRAKEILRHVDHCAECRTVLLEYKQIEGVYEVEKTPMPSTHVLKAISQKARLVRPPKKSVWIQILKPARAMGFFMVLVIVAGLGIFYQETLKKENPLKPKQTETIFESTGDDSTEPKAPKEKTTPPLDKSVSENHTELSDKDGANEGENKEEAIFVDTKTDLPPTEKATTSSSAVPPNDVSTNIVHPDTTVPQPTTTHQTTYAPVQRTSQDISIIHEKAMKDISPIQTTGETNSQTSGTTTSVTTKSTNVSTQSTITPISRTSSTPDNGPSTTLVNKTTPPSTTDVDLNSAYSRARNFQQTGNYDKASELYGHIYNNNPNFEQKDDVLYNWSNCLEKSGKHDEALTKLNILKSKNPQYPGLKTAYSRVNQAKNSKQKGNFEKRPNQGPQKSFKPRPHQKQKKGPPQRLRRRR